ncbi:MAG: SAM-dependent methyltransferase [Methanosphaera sp. rholeuAM270]|nr:MAG: SAM-dependent methyltransferase [Methanosphaera sp. rholeuAM270]
MHKSSYDKMLWFKNNFLDKKSYLKILDVGSLDTSGNDYNYKSIFNEAKWNYEGLDFRKGDNVDIVVEDIYNIQEINDKSYDVVISGQLFEHLGFFWLTMGEIDRILKPGGLCCIIAPSGGPKHGIEDTDCYRFYEDGMRALANYVNFEIIHASVNNNDNAKPWCDACLIAKKHGVLNLDSDNPENRIFILENKLSRLLKGIKK